MKVKSVLVFEGIANVAITAAKFIVGLQTGSMAIIGDALHSLVDVANNIVAVIAINIANKPPDHDHPYGHQKFEQLAVFVLATFLTVIAIEVALNAIERAGQPIVHSDWGLIVMLAVLVINIVLAIWENYWARKLDSDILNADARHTLSDVLTTVVVIIGWQLAANGYAWLDMVFAILVSLLVFYLAFDLYKKSLPGLVDQGLENPADLIKAVESIENVYKVKRFRSRTIAADVIADIVIIVDGQLSTEASHQVADSVEQLLADRFDIHDLMVHIEPEI